jgi:hypothetical protein
MPEVLAAWRWIDLA